MNVKENIEAIGGKKEYFFGKIRWFEPLKNAMENKARDQIYHFS